MFEETAKNEKEHAEQLLKLLKEINSSEDNLKAAVEKETYEYEDMYTEFERIAREEGELQAAELFKHLQLVEKHHADRFNKMQSLLRDNRQINPSSGNVESVVISMRAMSLRKFAPFVNTRKDIINHW